MSLSKPQKRRFITQDTLIRIAGSRFEYYKDRVVRPDACQMVMFLLCGKRTHAAIASLLKPCKFADVMEQEASIHREEGSKTHLALGRAEFEAFSALDMMPNLVSACIRGSRISVDNIVLKGLAKLTFYCCFIDDHTSERMYQMVMQSRETLKELQFPPLATFRRLPPMSLQTLALSELPQSKKEQAKLLSSFTFERFEWDYHETEQMPPEIVFALPTKHLKIKGESECFEPPIGAINSQLQSYVMETIDLTCALSIDTVLLERIEKTFPNLQECLFIVNDEFQERPSERTLSECIEEINLIEEMVPSLLPSFQTEFRIRVKLPVATTFDPKAPVIVEGFVVDQQSADLAKTGFGEQVLKRSLTPGPRTSFNVEITLCFDSMLYGTSDEESTDSDYDDLDHSEFGSVSGDSDGLDAMDIDHDPSDKE